MKIFIIGQHESEPWRDLPHGYRQYLFAAVRRAVHGAGATLIDSAPTVTFEPYPAGYYRIVWKAYR